MIFISAYGVVDGLFISNFVGDTAFAGLNLIGPATMIIGGIGFMFGAGGSALVSKKIGEGKKEEANQIFSGIVYFIMIIGSIVSVVCFFFIEEIAILLGATPEILPYAATYGKIFMIGEVAFMVQNLFQTFCATAEKAGLGFLLSVISGGINIALDILFVVGFKWGIAGAAISTVIGQTTGATIAIIYFARRNKSLLKLTKPNLKAKNLFKAMTNGSSEFLSNIATSVVSIAFNMQLLKYAGESGIVAYGVLMHVGFLFNSIFMGYSISTAPIVGYHYGAENDSEVKNVLNKSIVINIITGIILSGLAIGFAEPLSSIFISYDKALLDFTTNAMRIFAFSFILYGLNIFTASFFTALNNGLISAMVSTCRTLIFQTSMVLILPLVWGLNGIWYSTILAEVLSVVLCIIFVFVNKKRYNY
jgi:putative MATE family efflux protein